MATIAELLYLFRDGQPNKSIGPGAFQALISELHLAAGFFQDMPRSPAGLADGRLYLNGDVVQRAPGSVPASPLGNFLGAGSAVLIANVSFTRVAARSTLLGTSSLVATPQTHTATSSTGNFLGSGAATLFANPVAVVTTQFGNSVISGAGALSTAPQLWKPGVFQGSGVGAFSANADKPWMAAFSTMAGSGALAATVSLQRMAAGSAVAGSGALSSTPWAKRSALSTTAGAATLTPTAAARLLATTLSGSGAFSSAFSSAFSVSGTPLAGSAALIANPTVRSRASSTVAGSSALTANPVVPSTSAFSSAFSSAFGTGTSSSSAFSSGFSSAFG